MRMPRLHLPAMPSFGLAVPGFLTSRMTWLYVSYTLILFLVCLLITFPHDLVIRRVLGSLDRGPLGLSFSGAGLAAKGYEVAGLKIGGDEGSIPLLETSKLWVRPSVSELVRGNPYAVSISGELYGGSITGRVGYKNGGVAGTVEWKGLDLGRYRTLTAQLDEGEIAGKVSGSVTFEARGQSFQQGQANGSVVVDRAALVKAKINGWPIPDLHLTQTKTNFKVAGGRLELDDLVATGDVNLQGSGQIVIKDPFGESVLNLRATIAATPQTPDAIKAALALIPRPAGSKPDAPLTLTGTLSRPRLR
jgi:type II secretion system protein N